jgi:hypothetical protein
MMNPQSIIGETFSIENERLKMLRGESDGRIKVRKLQGWPES